MVTVCLVTLGVPATFAVTMMLPTAKQVSHKAVAGAELVVNGGFEAGTSGWKVNRAAQRLVAGTPAASGKASGQLSRSSKGLVLVNDAQPTITSTTKGSTYTVSARVRSEGSPISGRLRVREVRDGNTLTNTRTSFEATSSSWTRVEMTYTSSVSGALADLNVVGLQVPRGATLLVDDISMTVGSASSSAASSSAPPSSPSSSAATSAPPSSSATSPSSSAPTTPSSPASPSSPTSTTASPTGGTAAGCVKDPMGIPGPGQTFLGAAVSGGVSIEQRESSFGATLPLHRTYFSSGQIDAAVRQATADAKAGRLPWISFKEPYSWSQMSSGAGDSWAKELADKLKTVPGPVWLAIHHEPEKDGDMLLWTAMQRRIAPIIHSRTDNVAYTVIYSGWNTFGGGRNTLASKWPGDANVDVTAIDAYNDFGVKRGGKVGTKHLDIRAYYVKLAAWAKAHGTAWGIGETGLSKAAAADQPTWLTKAYQDMRDLGGAGLSYFDSNQNSVIDWRLNDAARAGQFKKALAGSARLC